MRGYQRRPCQRTPAPGGRDRYSLPMTARSFCVRKAILIHEPINRQKRFGLSYSSPSICVPLLLLFSPLFSALRKNSSEVLVVIRGSAHCQAWWQKQRRVTGRWCISHWCRGLITACTISGSQSGGSQTTRLLPCVPEITGEPALSFLKAPTPQWIKYWSEQSWKLSYYFLRVSLQRPTTPPLCG